jgi:hypothetical protein
MNGDSKLCSMLNAELERLKNLTGLGLKLTVAWLPKADLSLGGEVKNEVILIYEEEPQRAVETLQHEFLDFLICKAIEPYEQTTVLYKAMINGLLEKLGEKAYFEKERIVEALVRIFLQGDAQSTKCLRD